MIGPIKTHDRLGLDVWIPIPQGLFKKIGVISGSQPPESPDQMGTELR